MNALVLGRRYLADYSRNPVNLLVLVLVPVVFVVVAADTMVRFARLLGGAGQPGIEVATAGWSAGFLAGIAMYFQLSAGRRVDRRLVLSGLPRRTLITARIGTGAVLAVLGSAAALVALAVGSGLDRPARVVGGTLMFAVIYLAFGAVIGAAVPNPVNGTVTLLFVWIIDVFLGPTLTASPSALTRVLPTHFVSLWITAVPAGHGGPGSLTWALVWVVGASAVAVTVVARLGRVARVPPVRDPGSVGTQLRTGLRMAMRDIRRMPLLAVLLVLVPSVFILLADAITPDGRTPVTLRAGGRTVTAIFNPAHIHAGTMAPIAVGALAALAGIFIGLDSHSTDRRLVLAGQRSSVVLATRLGMIGLAVGLATGAAMTVTAAVFRPHQWPLFILGNVLVGATYSFIGVLLGRIFGRVSATFLAFLVPFLDLGMGQSPMLDGSPRPWAQYLPGYGAMRVLTDGALTSDFDERAALAVAAAWLLALGAGVVTLVRRSVAVSTSVGRTCADGPAGSGTSGLLGGETHHVRQQRHAHA